MTNYGNYELPVFEADLNTIEGLLRMSLHTIFFHRFIGDQNYEEGEFLNIYYVKLKNTAIDAEIENAIKNLKSHLIKSDKCQIVLNFYQKKVNHFIFSDYKNLWESWKMFFILKKEELIIENTKGKNLNNKDEYIREFLITILYKINDKFDFMPDIDLDKVNELKNETFPYDVKCN